MHQSELPPVFPKNLAKLKGFDFAKLLSGHVSKLSASGWTDVKIERNKKYHRKMVALHKEDEHVKAVVYGPKGSFKWSEAWSLVTGKLDMKSVDELC